MILIRTLEYCAKGCYGRRGWPGSRSPHSSLSCPLRYTHVTSMRLESLPDSTQLSISFVSGIPNSCGRTYQPSVSHERSMDSTSGGELFKFDRSLMERLSDNGMVMSQINVQRRMRPSISHFVRCVVCSSRRTEQRHLYVLPGPSCTRSLRTTLLSITIHWCKA
jgi:hypothetical protein